MNTDAELLRRFVEDHSEAAFTELVQRHLSLVRSTALRRVGGDAHAADDVTQQVFVALARKAPALRGHGALPGWLYLSTHHATASWVRREQRRKQREAAAHSMQLIDSSTDSAGNAARLRPLLDDALITLKTEEREALVLRFFSGRSFGEIGGALAVSEEAARKRVERALEKLHALLVRRGVTSTIAALGITLTAIGVESVPAGLAGRVAGAALSQAAAPSVVAAVAQVFWPAATAAALIGGAFAIVTEHGANAAAAAALAGRESELRIAVAGVQDETRRLKRELAQAHAADLPASSSVAVTGISSAPPIRSQVARPGIAVSVSPEGTLQWGGERVTLDEFLLRLVSYQGSAPSGESQIVVSAKGARFLQLNWVLDEVRKAGVSHLVVETDATPVGPMNTWF